MKGYTGTMGENEGIYRYKWLVFTFLKNDRFVLKSTKKKRNGRFYKRSFLKLKIKEVVILVIVHRFVNNVRSFLIFDNR